jgi:uncharacterized surface protein with fasciclin (FAS1) repeats
MMKQIYKTILNTAFILTLMSLIACQDKWKDHIQASSEVYEGSVLEQIQNNINLSKFADYLVLTGYDKVLKSDLNCTVWAPTNEAFDAIDQSLLTDTAELRMIIGNHIMIGLHMAQSIDTTVKMYALNGKSVQWIPKNLEYEGAHITKGNVLCGNGVMHILDKAIVPKKNLWEMINSASLKDTAPKFANFLSNYTYLYFDEAHSTKIGVNPSTGQNIYDSVKYTVYRFLQDVADVRDEKSYFTYFILTDQALDEQSLVYTGYFSKDTGSLKHNDDSLMWLSISKDYLFKSKISEIPDTLLSADSVKVPIDKSAIVGTFEASNGIIYVLNKSQINLKHKVKRIIKEGESSDRRIYSTAKFDIYTVYYEYGSPLASGYKYLYLNANHNTVDNYLMYNTTLFSCKYQVYWVAFLRDALNPNKNQSLTITMNGTETTVKTTAQTTTFSEVYLGDYTANAYGDALIKIKCQAGTANQLSLDYIKFVPVLP